MNFQIFQAVVTSEFVHYSCSCYGSELVEILLIVCSMVIFNIDLKNINLLTTIEI